MSERTGVLVQRLRTEVTIGSGTVTPLRLAAANRIEELERTIAALTDSRFPRGHEFHKTSGDYSFHGYVLHPVVKLSGEIRWACEQHGTRLVHIMNEKQIAG